MTLTSKAAPVKGPYTEATTNFIYEILFCDNITLFKKNNKDLTSYPWNILFADDSNPQDLQKMIDDENLEARHRILACNKLREAGYGVAKKDILGVIVEVGLEGGLDVLASYKDGTARYINQTGKMIIWEAADTTSKKITDELFKRSENIVAQIGPWDGERRPFPAQGTVRISFLVSDGLYFGEAPVNVLFNDPLAGPALMSATELMTYLTEKVIGPNQ